MQLPIYPPEPMDNFQKGGTLCFLIEQGKYKILIEEGYYRILVSPKKAVLSRNDNEIAEFTGEKVEAFYRDMEDRIIHAREKPIPF